MRCARVRWQGQSHALCGLGASHLKGITLGSRLGMGRSARVQHGWSSAGALQPVWALVPHLTTAAVGQTPPLSTRENHASEEKTIRAETPEHSRDLIA